MGTAGATFRPIVGGGEGEAADAPRPASRRDTASSAATSTGSSRRPRCGTCGAVAVVDSAPRCRVYRSSSRLYGQIVGINLDKGELMWSTPHGDTPDAVRNHPALKGINIPKTGQQGQRRRCRDQDGRRLG